MQQCRGGFGTRPYVVKVINYFVGQTLYFDLLYYSSSAGASSDFTTSLAFISRYVSVHRLDS